MATVSPVAEAASEAVEEAAAEAVVVESSSERVGGVMVPQRSPMFFLQSSWSLELWVFSAMHWAKSSLQIKVGIV